MGRSPTIRSDSSYVRTSRLIFLQFLSLLLVVAGTTVRTAATFRAGPAACILAGHADGHLRHLLCLLFLNPPKRTFFRGWIRWIVRMASLAKPCARRSDLRSAWTLVTFIRGR